MLSREFDASSFSKKWQTSVGGSGEQEAGMFEKYEEEESDDSGGGVEAEEEAGSERWKGVGGEDDVLAAAAWSLQKPQLGRKLQKVESQGAMKGTDKTRLVLQAYVDAEEEEEEVLSEEEEEDGTKEKQRGTRNVQSFSRVNAMSPAAQRPSRARLALHSQSITTTRPPTPSTATHKKRPRAEMTISTGTGVRVAMMRRTDRHPSPSPTTPVRSPTSPRSCTIASVVDVPLQGQSRNETSSVSPAIASPTSYPLARFEAEGEERVNALCLTVERRRKVIREMFRGSMEGMAGQGEEEEVLRRVRGLEYEWYKGVADGAEYKAKVTSSLEAMYA